MARIEIEQGGVYANANEFLAREVLMIAPDGDVVYNDYALSDGAPFGRQCRCSLGAFARWAARRLAADEIHVLRRDEGEARDRTRAEALIRFGLAAAPDELIRQEFYRRGLDRLPAPGKRTRPRDGAEGRPVVADARASVSRPRSSRTRS
jgi:hypothetical protein